MQIFEMVSIISFEMDGLECHAMTYHHLHIVWRKGKEVEDKKDKYKKMWQYRIKLKIEIVKKLKLN